MTTPLHFGIPFVFPTVKPTFILVRNRTECYPLLPFANAFSFELEAPGTKFIKDFDQINGYLLLETPS